PAELATPNPIVALEPITDDNLGGGSPQDRLGNRGTPRRGDGKDRRHRRNGSPQPDPDPPLPPRGLVNVGRGSRPHMLAKLLDRSLLLRGARPAQRAQSA